MLAVAELVATLACTVFAGAASYVSPVECPARMQCDTKTAATVWAPSYARATVMQAPQPACQALFTLSHPDHCSRDSTQPGGSD